MHHQDRDVSSSPIATRDDFDEPVSRSLKSSKRMEADIAFWSTAKRDSFALMERNPNAYFYRHVAPDETQRTGPWNAEEKAFFLEAMKVHPPTTGQWGLFARHIPGRVGYQCRNFYHRLLQSGELNAEGCGGEGEVVKRNRRKGGSGSGSRNRNRSQIRGRGRGRSSKRSRKVNSRVEFETGEEEPEISITDGDENSEDDESDDGEGEYDVPMPAPVPVSVPIVEESQPIEMEEHNPDIEPPVSFSTQLQHQHEGEQDGGYEHETEEEMPIPIPVAEESQSIEVEDKNPDIDSLVLFSTQLQHEEEQENENEKENGQMEEPAEVKVPKRIAISDGLSAEEIVKFSEGTFEYEASVISKANRECPLNMILFVPPGGEEATNEYINAMRSHLIFDTQSEKNGLIAAYFRVLQSPEGERQSLSRSFIASVLRTFH